MIPIEFQIKVFKILGGIRWTLIQGMKRDCILINDPISEERLNSLKTLINYFKTPCEIVFHNQA